MCLEEKNDFFLIFLAIFFSKHPLKCGCHGNYSRSVFLVFASNHYLYIFRKVTMFEEKIFCHSGVMLKKPQGVPPSPYRVRANTDKLALQNDNGQKIKIGVSGEANR